MILKDHADWDDVKDVVCAHTLASSIFWHLAILWTVIPPLQLSASGQFQLPADYSHFAMSMLTFGMNYSFPH